MAEKKRGADLEIERDPDFQRRDWTFEKIGRLALLLALVASAAGAFGRGPLAQAALGDTNDVRVEYDRIARHGARSVVRVELGGAVTRDTVVRVWLDRRYVDNIDIDAINPEPN